MPSFRALFSTFKTLAAQNYPGAIILLILGILYLKKSTGKSISSIKLSRFLRLLSDGSISRVSVNGSRIFFKTEKAKEWFQTNAELLTKDRIYKLLSKNENIEFDSIVPSQNNLFITLALYAAFYYFGYKIVSYYLDKKTGGRSITPEYSSNVKFTDIYGLDQAKLSLQEIINYLKNPAKYKAVGARLRRGVLLYGPSGIGKTMLAKAVAGEAGVAFLSCAASEFVELYVGVGPKRVRELFEKARKLSPCIIFIDEIDGIGTKRKSQFSGMESGGDDERTSTLNQLLTEMDGFKENKDIVIIAATNRATLLDEALLRSGRFDTKIKIELPSKEEREGIMKIHLRNKKSHISNQAIENIALESEGYSGADLENIVNESAYCCVQHGREFIENDDIQNAFNKIKNQRKVSYI